MINSIKNNNYPKEYLRGIANRSFISPQGFVMSNVFYPPDNSSKVSISWYDEKKVVDILFSQRKENGDFQFRYGIAFLPKIKLDEIIHNPIKQDLLYYERDGNNENPSHGNIIYRNQLPMSELRMIAANIALSVQNIIKREDIEESI